MLRRVRRRFVAEVIVALDVPGRAPALELVRRLPPKASFFKVGLELFAHSGPSMVSELRAQGRRVFLDLKLHDIPNTVGAAAAAAAELDVDLLTVHASGGSSMIAAARAAVAGSGTRVLAVTVLTSLKGDDLDQVWGRKASVPSEEVARLADLAMESGAHGVVCSVHEASCLRRRFGPDALIATPGIRLAGDGADDQARVATPREARDAGADFLVVGRSVTRAADPAAAFDRVLEELERE